MIPEEIPGPPIFADLTFVKLPIAWTDKPDLGRV